MNWNQEYSLASWHEVRGLSFDVEGLHIEVGLKTEVGGQHPHFNHCCGSLRGIPVGFNDLGTLKFFWRISIRPHRVIIVTRPRDGTNWLSFFHVVWSSDHMEGRKPVCPVSRSGHNNYAQNASKMSTQAERADLGICLITEYSTGHHEPNSAR